MPTWQEVISLAPGSQFEFNENGYKYCGPVETAEIIHDIATFWLSSCHRFDPTVGCWEPWDITEFSVHTAYSHPSDSLGFVQFCLPYLGSVSIYEAAGVDMTALEVAISLDLVAS